MGIDDVFGAKSYTKYVITSPKKINTKLSIFFAIFWLLNQCDPTTTIRKSQISKKSLP